MIFILRADVSAIGGTGIIFAGNVGGLPVRVARRNRAHVVLDGDRAITGGGEALKSDNQPFDIGRVETGGRWPST